MSISNLRRLAVAFGLAGSALAQLAPPAKDYAAALARYQQCIGRLPFLYHTEGREQLAMTRNAEALRLLIDDYDRKGAYPEYTRYTVASLLGRYFARAEFLPALDALRLANDKPIDTWLWVQVLTVMTDYGGGDEVLRIAQQDKAVLHRAAAILALGRSRRGDCEAAIRSNCVEFPKDAADRYAILGALSAAVDANRRRVNDDRFREALTAYISLLADDVDLPEPARLQIARHLQAALKGPALFVNQEPWLNLLKGGDIKTVSDARTVSSQRFFGVESEGERICYVVDMSDSMCKEIAPEVRPHGPITGPKKKPKGALPDESDLPWHKIRTRFDLAREHLRISLQRLSKDKHFCVVWFGDEAATLQACQGMLPATKANVTRVLKELDEIKVGEADTDKALDGKLKGRTNMHAGLRLAFSLAGKGTVGEPAYVDPKALTEGCDTIFLLSDGAPSIDEFEITDRDYGEGNVVVDQEYNVAAPRAPQINYPGPFVNVDWLVDDVTRMNLLRRVRVHCIAIGEANQRLLRRLADACYGQTFVVGAK